MPLAWDKKQNNHIEEPLPTAITLPLVQTIKRYEPVQEKTALSTDLTPKHIDDFKAGEYKEITIKPLNFQED